MKSVLKMSSILLIVLMFAGCDQSQYQIVSGPDNALYRFNKKTGELSMVMGDKKVVRLSEAAKSEVIKETDESIFERPSDWKESRYPGKNLKAKLETVWREGKLCYKFTLYPYKSLEKIFAKKKQDYIYSLMKPGLNLELIDKNGFLVKEIKVNLWGMDKIQAQDGTVKELAMNSQIDCTKQSYRSISGYAIKWFLEGDLIEDDKEDYIKSEPIRGEKR